MNFKYHSFLFFLGLLLFTACTKENIDQTTIDDDEVNPIVVMCDMEVQIENNSGILSPIITGGTIPYTIEWSTGEDSLFLAPLTNGDYGLTVTDSEGCIRSVSTNVTNADQCNTFRISLAHDRMGTLTIYPGGGTPPYAYLWASGETTQTINVSSGDYEVTVTDSNGCTLSRSMNISADPCHLFSSRIRVDSLSPTNYSLGLAIINGTAPYSFLWSTGSTRPIINVTTSGTYSIEIVDVNGCISTSSIDFVIKDPCDSLKPNISFDASINFLKIAPTGGTAPYAAAWSTGETTFEIAVVIGETYTVQLEDAAGCTVSESYTVQ